MKYLYLLLLFLLVPKSSAAITTFTQPGDHAFLYQGTFTELLEYHQNIAVAIANAKKNNDMESIASLCDWDCQVLTAMGEYEKARQMGLLSVQSYEALLATPKGKANTHLYMDYAWALCNLEEVCGLLFINLNEILNYHVQAIEAIKQWVIAVEEKGEIDGETAIRYLYTNISFSQITISMAMLSRDFEGGIGHIEKSIQEIEELYKGLEKDPHISTEYIMALQAYANIYNHVEDYEQSLRYWQESLKVIESVWGKQSRLYAYTLKEIGWVYYAVNDLETSINYFNNSLETYKAAGFFHSAEVADLMNLGGMVLLNCGMYDQATEALKQGGTLFEETCGKNSFPTSINKAFSIYPLWYTKQNKKAEKRMEELLKDSIFVNNITGDHLINALSFGIEMQRTDKQYKEIYANEEHFKKLIQTLSNPTKSAVRQYYLTMGRTYQSDNKPIEACSYFSQALDMQRQITRQNFAFLSEEQRTKFWTLDQSRIASILQQNQSRLEGNNAIGALLYDAALLQKSLLLEASINLAHIVEEKGTPQIKQQMRHLQMMMQSDLNEEQKRECQELEATVQNEARKLGDFLNYTNVAWTDVQKMLDDHSVAVEFVCSDSDDRTQRYYSAEVLRKGMERPFHLYLFSTTKDELTHGADKGTFNDFALNNIWSKRLLELFHPGDHIYFAPSGALHTLPIEYMPTENGQRMNETYQMHRLSSTRELVNQNIHNNTNSNSSIDATKKQATNTNLNPNFAAYLNRKAGKQPTVNTQNPQTQKSIALFGGFNFNASDDDIELAMANMQGTRGKNAQKATTQPSYWKNLPGTLNEVTSIAPIMEKAHYKVTLLTHNRGTEQMFKEQSGLHTDIIHVATHGFFEQGKGNDLKQSGLIFAGGQVLTAEEIAHLNLIGTHLTVLSACQTGLGKVTSEGVFGLQRSFKKAGVQSLLMSLWEVDDEATQLLMTAFYTHYAQGSTKQEALNAAQQEVRQHQFIRNGKEISGEAPQFWAGFILVDAVTP